MATPQTQPTSFLDKLQSIVNFPNALKLLGVVLLGLGIFKAWSSAGWVTKTLMVIGPITWYVGEKFYKIYNK